LIPAGNDVTVTLKNPAGSGFSAKDGKDSVNVIILPHEAHRADFINVYTPTGFSFGSFVSLNGLKVLEGRDWQEGDSFEFLLEMQNADGETWKEIGRASVTYNPNDPEFDPETFAEFHFASALASLQFSAAGTYTLRLSEVIGTLDNMAYDETVHYIDVVVGDSDMNGAYELQHLVLPETAVFVFDEATGRYEVKFIFNNSYTATDIPNSVKVSIGVRNDILNDTNGVLNPADFEFLMKLLESGAEIVQKTDANGKTVFTLEFSASDIGKTYTYTLSQVTGNIDNVEYSAKVYRISITIGVDENNQLTAAVVIDNVPQTTELIEVVFETIYDPESYWWHILLVPVAVKAVALPVAVVVRNKNQKEEE
jgi:pilin isopeptide linkage protein